MFSKILIANRGEIAVRVIRACKEMGIKTVAVYSEADRDALHTALADESICIGPAAAADSYLNPERIISAALATRASAIHPGYGFLSENADVAALCRKNGIAFIGPSAEEMNRLSDKARIKQIAAEAGLSTIPGTDTLSSVEEALEAAEKFGYPVMLKARSGGGGRGIRPAYSAEELREAYPLSVAESKAAFGDGGLYLEKCITPAHHIEVQIIADEHGNAVALGERDCSVQRHHQKLLEESPSPAVTKKMRNRQIRTCRIPRRVKSLSTKSCPNRSPTEANTSNCSIVRNVICRWPMCVSRRVKATARSTRSTRSRPTTDYWKVEIICSSPNRWKACGHSMTCRMNRTHWNVSCLYSPTRAHPSCFIASPAKRLSTR